MERNQPLLGINVDPDASNPQEAFHRARIADENGLDLITIQDHVYNRHFLEAWTLLSTLDLISGGRVELGRLRLV